MNEYINIEYILSSSFLYIINGNYVHLLQDKHTLEAIQNYPTLGR